MNVLSVAYMDSSVKILVFFTNNNLTYQTSQKTNKISQKIHNDQPE